MRKRRRPYVQLAREAREARLPVHAWEDMECELLWSLDDDVLSGGIPANHVLVLGSFEETVVRGEHDEMADERRTRTRRAL